MGEPTDTVPSREAVLSRALRQLRRLREVSPGQMADAMGLQRRTYEYFEAGRGKLNVDRVHKFAKILDVDPFAILAAVEIRSAAFAIACADHKLMTAFMVTLQEFEANAGPTIARLNAATIVSGFTSTFDALAREALEGEGFIETWLGKGDPPAASDESAPGALVPATDKAPRGPDDD
jgi:transcriptional regulator with XRE-family HTH domain